MYKGRVFETQRDLTFTLGEGGEIGIPRGIEMALEKMKKKERVEVKLAPKYAFGNVGRPDKNVPPLAHVTYEIDLVSQKLPLCLCVIQKLQKLMYNLCLSLCNEHNKQLENLQSSKY